MGHRQDWDDNVSEGWRAFHKLSFALSQAVLNCGRRGEVLAQLSQALASHRRLVALRIKREEDLKRVTQPMLRASMPLEWATDDMSDLMLALLHSLGKQLHLWTYRYDFVHRFARYRVVLFDRKERKAQSQLDLPDGADAAVLAAAWRTFADGTDSDAQLQGISASGEITFLPSRRQRKGGEG